MEILLFGMQHLIQLLKCALISSIMLEQWQHFKLWKDHLLNFRILRWIVLWQSIKIKECGYGVWMMVDCCYSQIMINFILLKRLLLYCLLVKGIADMLYVLGRELQFTFMICGKCVAAKYFKLMTNLIHQNLLY